MSALEILVDLLEDPHNNGDYRLNISGDDLHRLWRAIEALETFRREGSPPSQPAAGAQTPLAGDALSAGGSHL